MFASGFRVLAGLALAVLMLELMPPPKPALATELASLLDVARNVSLHSEDFVRANWSPQLFGPASGWWEAAPASDRNDRPAMGSLLLLTGYCDGACGHAAIVTRIVSAREIRIDHADWLHDGAIYRNNPVADVSWNNDWSRVRVFNIRTGSWGGKVYAVRGFLRALRAAEDDRNPPPDSPFALTPEDRSIPSSFEK